jgi:chromate transport protein ChrA
MIGRERQRWLDEIERREWRAFTQRVDGWSSQQLAEYIATKEARIASTSTRYHFKLSGMSAALDHVRRVLRQRQQAA